MPKAIKIDQYRYMTNEAWRILMAVEMGMKNHEFVPPDLVHKISRCSRRGASFLKILRDDLVPHGLLAYATDSRNGYSGYRLTNLGYDYLALHTLIKSDQVSDLGSMIGAGKESDVYLAVAGSLCGQREDEEHVSNDLPIKGDYIVIKFHRLGRTSFRKVREKREYHQGRNTCSWLYLDRLAAKREFEMMKILYDSGIPVPCPLANNRNAVVMSLLSDAIPLCKVLPTTLRANDGAVANSLYKQAVKILNKITRNGLIHGDFNEYNLLVGGLNEDLDDTVEPEEDNRAAKVDLENVKLILIDFPQMISRDHRTAQEIYKRDLHGILEFFGKYLELDPTTVPPSSLSDIARTGHMDVDLKAPGYLRPNFSKKGAPSGKFCDTDVLVGTVLAVSLNESDDETVSEDEDSEENSNGNVTESENSYEDSSGECGSTSSEHKIPGKSSVASSTCIGRQQDRKKHQPLCNRDDVKERKKREEKKRIQNEFLLRVKRQQRASAKKKGRAEIAAEIKLFD